MRSGIIVLYNDSPGLIKGEPRDMLAERGVVTCALAIAEALESRGFRVARLPLSGRTEDALQPFAASDWLVFNLYEGLEGRLFEEARFAWALEAMGYCFTGNRGDALARSTHKGVAKALLEQAGVPTPAWQLFRHPDEVSDGREIGRHGLRFPLIVKPVAEDASLGIGHEAVVHGAEALRERVAYVVQQYRQAALVEEYIIGREFNLALWGDPVQVLPLAEIDFSAFNDPCQRLVSFAAKWEESSFDFHHTPAQCPAQVEPAMARCITEAARRAWQVIGCRGYARVDVRVDGDGTPHVIEVNCNPDLSSDAGFARAARADGYDYTGMITHIVDLAIAPECAISEERRIR